MVAFTPFNGSLRRAKEMVNRLYHAGLMSFIAGSNPVRIRFLLPLGCVEESHIDLACQILEQVTAEMAAQWWECNGCPKKRALDEAVLEKVGA